LSQDFGIVVQPDHGITPRRRTSSAVTLSDSVPIATTCLHFAGSPTVTQMCLACRFRIESRYSGETQHRRPCAGPSVAIKEFSMLTCSNCGASVREGARFCTTCGTRLNDPVATDATSVWSTPVTSEPAVSRAEPVAVDATWSDDTLERDDASPAPEATTESSTEPVAGEDSPGTGVTSETPPAPDEGFSWSWGTSSSTSGEEATPATAQVDEESGIVLEEARTAEATEDTEPDELVDPTEIDILEADESGTGSELSADDGPEPETSDTMLVVEDEDGDGDGAEETETLAAWAEQWETSEPEDEAAAIADGAETAAEHPSALEQAADTGVSDGVTETPSDSEEDTVARADRLIGELRSMIPSLLRPMPSTPAFSDDPAALADDLEGAARAGRFDDLRETLLNAREHPRDVDTMLNLSGKINRLIELLEDRDNLAQTAERTAARLRPGSEATSDATDI